jgi:hypothetical protein
VLEDGGWMHCTGLDAKGRRRSGGMGWAFCRPCQQWFCLVHSANKPPPSWEPCEPPPDPAAFFGEESGAA